MSGMFKETELWFKSLRKQDQPTSKQKRKRWSLSRSLPELQTCEPADAARARQHTQESRLRRRTVQVQRRLEALVEQSRRQTALLLRRQQRATAVQKFLRHPVVTPHYDYEDRDERNKCCSVAEPCGCRGVGDQLCAERLAWWQSDPNLCRELCCPGTPCRPRRCDPQSTQQRVPQNRSPLLERPTQNYCPPQQGIVQNHCSPQQELPQNYYPPQHEVTKNYSHAQQATTLNHGLQQQGVSQNQCHAQQGISHNSGSQRHQRSQNNSSSQQGVLLSCNSPQKEVSQNCDHPQQRAAENGCHLQLAGRQSRGFQQQGVAQTRDSLQQGVTQDSDIPQQQVSRGGNKQNHTSSRRVMTDTHSDDKRVTTHGHDFSQQVSNEIHGPPKQEPSPDKDQSIHQCQHTTTGNKSTEFAPQSSPEQTGLGQDLLGACRSQELTKPQTDSALQQSQQTKPQSSAQPSQPHPDKGILRRTSKVTFDPVVVVKTDIDNTRREKSKEVSFQKDSRKNSDTEEQASFKAPGCSPSAATTKTMASRVEVPSKEKFTTESDRKKSDSVKPTTDCRKRLNRHGSTGDDAVAMKNKFEDIPEQDTPRSSPVQMPTASGDMSYSEKQHPTSDCSAQPCCQDTNQTGHLAVVGQHCRLSPRRSVQKKYASGKMDTSVEDRSVIISDGYLACLSIEQSSQLPGKAVAGQQSNIDGSNNNIERESGKELHRTTADSKSDQQDSHVHTAHNSNSSSQCNHASQGLMAPERERTLPSTTRSFEKETYEENAGQLAESSTADRTRSGHVIRGCSPGHSPAQDALVNAPKEDTRAFFIDLATGESCAIQSLSAEPAGFRGNRTLLLRQLLSQQKIDEAEHRRKRSSPKVTRRRAASKERVQNLEMVMDTFFHNTTSMAKHQLPMMPSRSQFTTPLAMPPPESYFDVKDIVRYSRNHDHVHCEEFPQMRVKRHNSKTPDLLERMTESQTCKARSSEASLMPFLEPDRFRTGIENVSSTDPWTLPCDSLHHHCGYLQRNSPHRIHSGTRQHHKGAQNYSIPNPALANDSKQHCASYRDISKSAPDLNAWSPAVGYGAPEATREVSPESRVPLREEMVSETCVSKEYNVQQNSHELSATQDHSHQTSTLLNASSNDEDHETASVHETFHKPVKSSRLESTVMQVDLETDLPHSSVDHLLPEMVASDRDERSRNVGTQSGQFQSSETESGKSLDEQLDDTAEHEITSTENASLVTSARQTSHKACKMPQLPAVPDTIPLEPAWASNRPGRQTHPLDSRQTQTNPLKKRLSLPGRVARGAPSSLPAAGAKSWTTVTLVSPQDMEMTLSLSTHLPNIGDQSRRYRQRQQRTSTQDKDMNEGTTP